MAVFDDVRLYWRGAEIIIPAHRVLGAIARIEDHLTLFDLQAMQVTGKAKLTKLASAFAAVVRYADPRAVVSDDEVYGALFSNDEEEGAKVGTALGDLLKMMVPPERLVPKGPIDQGKAKPTTAESSKPSSKRRSDKPG